MHSPPETENNHQFVHLANVFRERGIPVPDVYAFEPEQGFILVTDFGSNEFLDVYGTASLRHEAVRSALTALIELQHIKEGVLPAYTTTRLKDEIGIFKEWVCEHSLNCDSEPLSRIEDGLISEIDKHPKVSVHRDYHSRNLLFDHGRLGIVDFQDALFGSCVYDLASLLYDCYYQHQPDEVDQWIDEYRELLQRTSVPAIKHRDDFVRALELTAIQRQLKAIGIFCRLWFVQSKSTHLPYIEPVLETVIRLAEHQELQEMSRWLKSEISPKMKQRLQEIST